MIIFLFESTHAVIKAEKLIKNKYIPYKIIPTPKSISPQCGMAIEVTTKEMKSIARILMENNVNCKVLNQSKEQKQI